MNIRLVKLILPWSAAVLISTVFCLSCTDLDDKPLPGDALGKVYFQSFEIDPNRNYILGRIVNDSPYTLTSCRIAINIYLDNLETGGSFDLKLVDPGDTSLTSKTPLITEKMFMRETLKPGYSTEVYFEFPMEQLRGRAVYTRQIIELKGKVE